MGRFANNDSTINKQSISSKHEYRMISGRANVQEYMKNWTLKAGKWIDVCTNDIGLSNTVNVKPYLQYTMMALERGARIRFIGDITKSNLTEARKIASIVSELRHASPVNTTLVISENGIMMSPSIIDGKVELRQFVSESKELISRQKELFETLWHQSVPADQRIDELEGRPNPMSLHGLRQAAYILRCIEQGIEMNSIVKRFGGDKQLVNMWISFAVHNYWMSQETIIAKARITSRGKEWVKKLGMDSVDLRQKASR
jgi:hypothetical protein